MGTVLNVLPKTLILPSGNQKSIYNNMMAPPGGGDNNPPSYSYVHYGCSSGSIVCQGTNEEDENGNPINFQIIPTQVCITKAERYGELPKPSCNQSRGTGIAKGLDFKNPGIKEYAILGGGALVLIAVTAFIIKASKKSA